MKNVKRHMMSWQKNLLAAALVIGAVGIGLDVWSGSSQGNPRFVPFHAEGMKVSGLKPENWMEADVGGFLALTPRENVMGTEESVGVKFMDWGKPWVVNSALLLAELERWKPDCQWAYVEVGAREAFRCGDNLKGDVGILRAPGKIIYLKYAAANEEAYGRWIHQILESFTFEQ